MLTKRQLENAARCKFAQGCNRKCCFYSEQARGDGDIVEWCSLLIDELAKTALAYRTMLERACILLNNHFCGDKHYSYVGELTEVKKALKKIESLLKESEGEGGVILE